MKTKDMAIEFADNKPTAHSRYVLLKDITDEIKYPNRIIRAGTEFTCCPVGPRLRFHPKDSENGVLPGEPYVQFTAEEICNKQWFMLIPELIDGSIEDVERINKWYEAHSLRICKEFYLQVSENSKVVHTGLCWHLHKTEQHSFDKASVRLASGDWVVLASMGWLLPEGNTTALDIWHFIASKGFKIPDHYANMAVMNP